MWIFSDSLWVSPWLFLPMFLFETHVSFHWFLFRCVPVSISSPESLSISPCDCLYPHLSICLSLGVCPSMSVLGVPPPQPHSLMLLGHCPPHGSDHPQPCALPTTGPWGPQSPTWLHLPCLQRPLGCAAPAWASQFLSHRPGVRAGRNFTWPLPRTSAGTFGAGRAGPAHRPQLPL